ncbi:hypothetical protein TrVE_jg2321 [Triparma verrucosa]|uniref:Ribosomal protein L22 n=1 Tax=Triparma verrucosa TaxID=1606542 RepID=A0A9W7KWB5_9STRA|nr:hypothetical protein TrVE_jg2321 [Triparma verrucosa]
MSTFAQGHRPCSIPSPFLPLHTQHASFSTQPSESPSSPVRYGTIVKERFNKTWSPSGLTSPKFVPKTVQGRQKDIRVSPWKLNLICAQIRTLRVSDARLQLKFSSKRKAPLVSNVIRRTTNLADIRYDLKPESLCVTKAFVTQAKPLKRMKFHARGKFGRKTRRHAHLNIEVGEIDFEKRIADAKTKGQKLKWERYKEEAAVAQEIAKGESEELRKLQGLMPREEEVWEEEEEGDGEFEEVKEAEYEEKKK